MTRRIFIATGEPSGELAAVELAGAMRALDPDLAFAGIGAERMRDAGFALRWETHGWASLGPIEALSRIPKLMRVMFITAAELRARPPSLVVLVDFGAFNLRLARQLRRMGYRGPICYYFPPAAWLDNPERARMVAKATRAVTPFTHQRDFYASLGLPIEYFGHPLVSTVEPRAPRPPAPPGGGRVAILPGSRRGEVARHAPILFDAARLLRVRRRAVTFVVGVANDDVEATLRETVRFYPDLAVEMAPGARGVLVDADAAWIASGTAVLEAALIGVPSVALYIVSKVQERIGRRFMARAGLRYVTPPNLVLDAPVVPELLQERATQIDLVETLEAVLDDPARQTARFDELRAALGPPDALERTAAFAVELASG